MKRLQITCSLLILFLHGLFTNAHAEINPTGRPQKSSSEATQLESLSQRQLTLTKNSLLTAKTVVTSKTKTDLVVAGKPQTAQFTGLSNITGPAAATPLSNSVTFSFSPSSVTLSHGESATIDVTVNRSQQWLNGSQAKFFFVTVVNEPEGVTVQQSQVLVSGSSFSIEVSVGPNAQAGTYSPEVYALIMETNNQQAYTHRHSFDIHVENNTAEIPAEDFAELYFSPLAGVDQNMYTTGYASCSNIMAVYDSNNNQIIDFADGLNNTPFPGFPIAGGGSNAGRAYAAPHGEQANIIVAGQYGPTEWVSLHLQVKPDGQVQPIQLLVGDFLTGEVMIQDASGWSFNFTGMLPDGGQPGFIAGYISSSPFTYDGVENVILGNQVEFTFDVALHSDW